MAIETKYDLTEDSVEVLQDLTRINIDSYKGFREAADQIEDSILASKLRGIADDRERQAKELQQYVNVNGEEAVKEGSYAAAFHRCWMKTREVFTSNDTYAIMAEAERGEDHIKAAYEDALKKEPATAVNDVLMQQYKQVKQDHDNIRDIRDSLKD